MAAAPLATEDESSPKRWGVSNRSARGHAPGSAIARVPRPCRSRAPRTPSPWRSSPAGAWTCVSGRPGRAASPTARSSRPRSRAAPAGSRAVTASDDALAMRGGLATLGVAIEGEGRTWTVSGSRGRLAVPTETVDVRASGTTARFLTAAASLAAGPARIDGIARMRERPIDDLVGALAALGAPGRILGEGGLPSRRDGRRRAAGRRGDDRRRPLEPVRIGAPPRRAVCRARCGAPPAGREARLATLRRSHAST